MPEFHLQTFWGVFMDIKTLEQQISDVVQTGSLGIKETMDVLVMLDAWIDAYEKAKADGKIDLDDIQHSVSAIVAAVEAFKDADQIPAELKDLDSMEATQLFSSAFTLIQRLIKVISAKEVAIPVIFPAAR
jgi:hypothetical protein